MRSRRGFTLVEMLVVIAIISILAGFVLVALQRSRLESYKAECWNNFKQISYALMMYRDDHREGARKGDVFPERLTHLFSRNYIPNQEVFLCRMDSAHGTDGSRSDHRFDETFETGPGGTWGGNGACPCSYFYEMAGVGCTWCDSVGNAGVWGPPTAANPTGDPSASPPPVLNLDGIAPTTWAEVKYCQMTYGDDYSHDNPLGGKTNYPPTKFPVVRCSWHAKTPQDNESSAYINLAYAGNVFYSGAEWERVVTGAAP